MVTSRRAAAYAGKGGSNMPTTRLAGKAQTVLGPVAGAELGITLAHEHILFDGSALYSEPSASSDKARAFKPVDWDVLSWLRYHPFENLDNLRLLDEEMMTREVLYFKAAGGQTIVDQGNNGLGRDVQALARVSRLTGLNIIMGSGYYTANSLNHAVYAKSVDEMADEIVKDITEGVGATGIKAGLIGEIGTSWPIHEFEKKSLLAAVKAQRATGAPMNVHPGRHPLGPITAARILVDAGADMSRVAFSHIDGRIRTREGRIELANLGCYLEYDLFGYEGHFPVFSGSDPIDLPNDTTRVYEIRDLADAGFINRILISHDIVCKTKLVHYGGWGYAHISNYVVPMMLMRGISREVIDTIMVENPRRFCCFA
jgi:phosphotriesterase-related protein